LLSFLASFCPCFSVCVFSLLQSCFVLFIQLFLGEWSSMLASPPPPICLSRWSPFSAVRRGTAVHTCIPPNYFTVTNWLLPSLTLSSSYLSLSLSHALTTMYTRFPSSPPSLITLRHRLPTPPVSLSYACTVGFVNYLRGDGEILSCPVFGLEALAWSQMADHCVKHMKNRPALHRPHVHYELQVIYKL